MAGDDPVRICLDELRNTGGIGAARDMAEQRSTALLGLQGAASELVAIALAGEGGERERCLDLFGALIGEAREDGENRGHLGGRFLEEAAASIAMLVAEGRLEHTDALDLTNAYVVGEVDAPDNLVAFLMARLNALARAEGATGTGGLDAEIDRVRQAAEDDHDLYRVVDKWLAVFPARRKAGIVRHIAGRPEEFGGRLALYWLLGQLGRGAPRGRRRGQWPGKYEDRRARVAIRGAPDPELDTGGCGTRPAGYSAPRRPAPRPVLPACGSRGARGAVSGRAARPVRRAGLRRRSGGG